MRTTKAWMNAIAPLARPVFAWNHHAVMKQGGVGLARELASDSSRSRPADETRTKAQDNANGA